jgi:uncharacterized damage-inducible protein DinB
MSKTTQSSMRVAVDDPSLSDDQPMSERTAAELRELCEETGEPFDTALSELQARERIAALRVID